LLGTFVEVSLPEARADLAERAFDAMAAIHATMSFHEETSDLAATRRVAAGRLIEVSAATVSVLRVAALLHAETEGLFDVTIGRELVEAGLLPTPPGVRLTEFSGRFADLEIVDDIHIRCHRPMLIDLGGIAKGYAVDCAIDALRYAGVECAVVNAGGDLRVLGAEPQTVWLRNAANEPCAPISLADGAVATSSNRPGQIPHFGRDRRAIASHIAVSVIAPTCMEADAFTKIALADRGLARRLISARNGDILVPEELKAAA
jgi:FAD:protein FMN transferase